MFRIEVGDDLEMRLLEESDAERLFALTDENRAYLRRWLPWLDDTTTVAHTQAFIRSSLEQFAEDNYRLRWFLGPLLDRPIHAIDGHAQLLEDEVRGPLTDAQRDSVARIRRSARALMGLIEDLLELARAEAGQLTVKLDRVVL